MAVKVEVMRSCVIPYFLCRPFTDFFFSFNKPVPFFLLPLRVLCAFMIWGFLLSM